MGSNKIRKFYLSEIKNQIGATPIWPINSAYQLGDYGYYSNRTGHFSVRGNIFEDFNLEPTEHVNRNHTKLYSLFSSSNAIRNNFQSNVSVTPNEGSLDIQFEGDKSYVFHLFKAEVAYLSLNDRVRDQLKKAAAEKKWDHRYRIIELVYECPDVRFSFSLSKSSSIKLAGKVDSLLPMTNANINYKIESSSFMEGNFWIENSFSTPFVKFASFKRRELKIQDEKVWLMGDWYLEKDDSSSFDEDED